MNNRFLCSTPPAAAAMRRPIDRREGTLTPMFETIVSHVSAAKGRCRWRIRMLVTLLDRDNFLGRI
jgi:GTP-binding protein